VRRTLATLVISISALGLGACSQVKDAAQQVADKVECGATTKLVDQLPQGSDLDRSTITRGASLAKQIDSILTKIPGDKVPASITDPIHTAAVDLDAAAQGYDADPAAAKAKAAEAVSVVRTAVADATKDLGC
jgi:hypothetical protein